MRARKEKGELGSQKGELGSQKRKRGAWEPERGAWESKKERNGKETGKKREYGTVGSAIALHVIGHEFKSHYFQKEEKERVAQ